MANNVVNLLSVCSQRLQNQQYRVVPSTSRLQTPSPYDPGNTSYQGSFLQTKLSLDMRRKAEVLKHATTNTNATTRAEKWTKIVNGKYRTNILFCPQDRMILTPTSSSDVPGPIVQLYDDESIPLYNYATNIDAYSTLPAQPPELPFNSSPIYNVFCNTGVDTKIATLIISESVIQKSYNFTVFIPIAFYFNMPPTINTNLNGYTINYSGNTINLSTTSISVGVYYSGEKVTTTANYAIDTTNSINLNATFTVGPSNTATTFTSGYCYAGVLTISNLVLNTSPGFVYDIYLNPNVIKTISTIDTLNFPEYGIVANMNYPYPFVQKNISIVPNSLSTNDLSFNIISV
jgi:hypothetical protein